MVARFGLGFPLLILLSACGSDPDPISGGDAGGDAAADVVVEAAPPPPLPKNIQHVVVIVQENHTFDAYFGHYLQGARGLEPHLQRAAPTAARARPTRSPRARAGHAR